MVLMENLTELHTNIKGADQPTHPGSLISSYVVRFQESIIDKHIKFQHSS